MRNKQNFLLSRLAVVCAALTAVCCLAAFFGCAETPDTSDTKPTPTPTPKIETETVSNVAAYTIMRSDLSGTDVGKAAAVLYRTLSARYEGVSIDTDWTKDESGQALEILVGDTNRSASAAAAEKALAAADGAEEWFYIGMEGTKIVILGSNERNTTGGVWYFVTRYVQPLQTGENMMVPKSYCYTIQTGASLIVENSGEYVGDSFFAEAVVTGAPYFADNTGELDVTAMLQSAIDAVSAKGGGIVYLPAGTYLVTASLNLPSYVCLRGAYADPDEGSVDRGTVICIAAKSEFKNKSVVNVASSACVQGIAFYQQGQSVSKPLEYAAVLNCNGNCFTVKDCTFLNCWQGINTGTSPHGMSTLDGVKGTVLYRGYENLQTADICVSQNVHFSPRYWANAGEAFGAPAEADIRNLMKENKSVGFYLKDNDRDTYEDITLDGFYTGIYGDVMTRSGTSGSFYRLTITDAVCGMDMHGVDARYGLLVAEGHIEGSAFAVSNDTDGENCTATGAQSYVNLLASTVTGKTVGGVRTTGKATEAEIAYTPYENDVIITAEKFYDMTGKLDNTGKTDVSAALQTVLNEAKDAIVYLPAGKYRLEKSLTVGERTVLTGCAPFTQGTSGEMRGTILLVTYGRDGTADDTAAIRVTGVGSGVQGMTVYYPKNGVTADGEGNAVQPAAYSPFVELSADKTFARFLTFGNVSRAVRCVNCKEFILDRILMTAFDEAIRIVGCQRGLITRIHTNGTYHTSVGANGAKALADGWFCDGSKVYTIIDGVICARMTLMTLENSTAMQATNVFHYGAKQYLHLKNSDITVINGESGHQDNVTIVQFGISELKIVNFIRLHAGNNLDRCLTGINEDTQLYNFDCAHTNVFNYVLH